MRILLAFLLSVALAAAQIPPMYTFGVTTSSSANATNMNNASTVYMFRLVPRATKTVSKVKYYVGGVTGGPMGANDSRMELVKFPGAGPMVAVTFNDTSDYVDFSGHPFANGDKVAFSNTGGALPTAISQFTTYYVCNRTANTFQIDDDPGCASLVSDFTTGASGTHMVRWLVEVSNTVTAPASAAGWVEHTGFTSAITRSGTYAFLVWNQNATPGTTYFSIRAVTTFAYSLVPYVGSAGRHGFTGVNGISTTAGSSWASSSFGSFRVEYDDGTFEGIPIYDGGAATFLSERVYDTNEVGVRYVIPSTAPPMRVIGVGACFKKVSNPGAGLRFKLYTGADGAENLAATTDTMPAREISASGDGCSIQYFAAAQTIQPNTVIRVMAAPASSGDSSANYYSINRFAVEDNADSKAMILHGAQLAKNANGTWTYDSTAIGALYLVLDTQEFDSGGSSGGVFGFVQ